MDSMDRETAVGVLVTCLLAVCAAALVMMACFCFYDDGSLKREVEDLRQRVEMLEAAR